MNGALRCFVCALLSVLAAPAQPRLPDSVRKGWDAVPLDPADRDAVRDAIETRDYKRAEKILVQQIEARPKSARLLTLAARVFVLDKDSVNAVIAFKKADAIQPLEPEDRFALAMSYLGIGRREWARQELTRLSSTEPDNVAYLYWLGRIDYDGRQYGAAIVKLQRVVATAPGFMRAWDNLGLSLEGAGRLDDAVEAYTKAVELNRNGKPASPWPPLNFGTLLTKMARYDQADTLLREAIGYDDELATAHARLGINLQRQQKNAEAIHELRRASELAPSDPTPLYALGQLYRADGNKAAADDTFARFRVLKQAQRGSRQAVRP